MIFSHVPVWFWKRWSATARIQISLFFFSICCCSRQSNLYDELHLKAWRIVFSAKCSGARSSVVALNETKYGEENPKTCWAGHGTAVPLGSMTMGLLVVTTTYDVCAYIERWPFFSTSSGWSIDWELPWLTGLKIIHVHILLYSLMTSDIRWGFTAPCVFFPISDHMILEFYT